MALSSESLARLEKVRTGELEMDDLEYPEIEALLSEQKNLKANQGGETTAAPAAEVGAPKPTEDGGATDTTVQKTETAKVDTRSTKQRLADEANTANQRLQALPHKLKDPEYRKQWFKDHGIVDETPAASAPAFDKDDIYSPSNMKTVIDTLEQMKERDKIASQNEARRDSEEALHEEVDTFLATVAPELSPKEGSWRTLNKQLSRAWELAGNDPAKVNDPEFQKTVLAPAGISLPKDPAFDTLSEVCALRKTDTALAGLSLQDVYAVWQGRNPQKKASAPFVPTTAMPESDRAKVVLGGNGGNGGQSAIGTLGERLQKFDERVGGLYDNLTPAQEAEYAGLRAEFDVVRKK